MAGNAFRGSKLFKTIFHKLKSRSYIAYIERTPIKISKKCNISISEDRYCLSKHSVAFHLGLHCLPKYPVRGFRS